MMKLYKLTDENGQTYNGTQWGEDVTHTAPGKGKMCGPGWIHAYRDPALAILLNPIHADFRDPRLWEAEGKVGRDDGCKVGTARLTTVREIPAPKVTTEQRVHFAILCALEVYADERFIDWANGWLSAVDRTGEAARAPWAKSMKMTTAAWAAKAAAKAAEALHSEANAAEEEVSWAAEKAVYWATEAVYWATAKARKPIDLAPIANKSVEVKQ